MWCIEWRKVDAQFTNDLIALFSLSETKSAKLMERINDNDPSHTEEYYLQYLVGMGLGCGMCDVQKTVQITSLPHDVVVEVIKNYD